MPYEIRPRAFVKASVCPEGSDTDSDFSWKPLWCGRTGVEKAEESQEAGPGPLSRSSSPGARRQLLSRGTSLARMRSGKLGLARLQSLPAKAARKTGGPESWTSGAQPEGFLCCSLFCSACHVS